jgi:hypothetical protein
MTEELKQSVAPEERLSAAFSRFFLHVNNLQVFYATTTDLLEVGKSHVEQKLLKTSNDEFAKPEVQQLFSKDNPLLQNKTLFNFVTQAFARRSVQLSGQMIGSATIVFAHTILDELLSECCLISFEAAPSDWYPFVKRQTVELGALEAETPSTLLHQKALKYVNQLSRESMVSRLNLLNQLCIPKLSTEQKQSVTVLMDVKKLGIFDELRHRIIHDKPFAQNITEVEEKVLFVLVTGIAAMLSVGNAYGLFQKEKFKGDSIILNMLAGMQDELPELKGLIESLTKLVASLTQATELIKKLKIQPNESHP